MDALGHDPAPGDPADVRRLAAEVRRRARAGEEEAARLVGWESTSWSGAGAEAFVGQLGTLPDDLASAARTCRTVAGALDGYADALASAQARTRALRRRAEDAVARAAAAGAACDAPVRGVLAVGGPADGALATGWHASGFPRTGAAVAAADPAALDAARRRDAAEADLWAAQSEAWSVAAELDEAGRAAARQVTDACSSLPGGLRPLARAVGVLAGLADEAWDDVLGWVREHATAVRVLADVAAVVGTTAGWLAVLVPVTAPVAGAVAGVAAGVGLAANGLLVAAGEKEPSALWPDVLAVGTLGVSRLVTGPVKLAPALAPYTITGARAVAAGRPATEGSAKASSVFAGGYAMDSRELLVRSVKFVADTPPAAVGGVAAVGAVRNLWELRAGASQRTAAPERPEPEAERPERPERTAAPERPERPERPGERGRPVEPERVPA